MSPARIVHLKVDPPVINGGLVNFGNPVKHGLLNSEASRRVEIVRVQQQFEAMRSAWGV